MKIKALVVDDDKIQLRLFTAFLKKMNFEGNTAINGEEAVNMIFVSWIYKCLSWTASKQQGL